MCWDCISCCLESTPGVWSLVLAHGLLRPCLCQVQLAKSPVSAGRFWLGADTASFHGHKHFPVPLQLQAFGVYGPALCDPNAAPALAGAFQAVHSWEGSASCLTGTGFVPWQDPGAWRQKKPLHFPLTPNLTFSLLFLQGRAVKEPHTPRLEEIQGCQD